MRQADFLQLAEAAQRLETTSLVARLGYIMGMPLEKALAALPGHWSSVVAKMTRTALEKAMDSALYSLKAERKKAKPVNKTHKLVAAVSGVVGGGFGLTALALELPISATLMMRSIADIARSHGEDLSQLDAKMACLSVFALTGGDLEQQENANTSYYAVRSFLSKAIADSGSHIAARGISQESAPALINLLSRVSARFSIPVSEKAAAQALPALGAIGGASINLLFMQHYQQMAEAHFTIRRLERQYGKEHVQRKYHAIMEKAA